MQYELLHQINALPAAELVNRYAIGVENLDRRVLELPNEQLDAPFSEEAGVGLWPCRVLLGHICDAELVFTWRTRRLLAEDAPMLTPMDEQAMIRAGLYGTPSTGHLFPAAGFVGMIYTVRKWHADLLRTLNDEHWSKRGLHPEHGQQTIRAITNYAVFHLEHHATYLKAKLDAMLGKDTEPDPSSISLPIAKH